jgi:hypothetical protein
MCRRTDTRDRGSDSGYGDRADPSTPLPDAEVAIGVEVLACVEGMQEDVA